MTLLPSDIYKAMILQNPFQHKWRRDCLFSIFFDSKSSFSFSEDGNVVPSFDVNDYQVMNHDPKPYAKSLKGLDLSKKEIAIRKAYEKDLYIFIEENIDAISKSPDHFNKHHFGYHEVYPADNITVDSLFFNIPENINPIWVAEIRFVASTAAYSLWQTFCGKHEGDDDDSLWSNKEAYVLNKRIWSILESFKKDN